MSVRNVRLISKWRLFGMVAALVLTLASLGWLVANERAATTFWAGLQSSEPAPDGQLIYTDLSEIRPGGPGSGPLLPADVVLRGTIQGLKPGIGYASNGDSDQSVVVPFDSPKAVVKWARLVIRIDQVLVGGLASDASTLEVAWEVPREAEVGKLDSLAASAGEGIFYLSPGAERLRRTGKPIPDEDYYANIYLVVGSAAFIEDGSTGDLLTPLLDDGDKLRITDGATSLDEIAAVATRT